MGLDRKGEYDRCWVSGLSIRPMKRLMDRFSPRLLLSLLVVQSVTGATADGLLQAAPPTVTGLSPPVVQVGKTVEITVKGTNLEKLQDLSTAAGSLETVSIEKTRVRIRVKPDAPTGTWDAWARTVDGLANPRSLQLVAHPVVVADETADTTATPVSLPGTVAARLDRAADRDRFQFNGRRNQWVSITCRSSSLDGTVSPILTLTAPDGRELAHSPDHLAEPTITHRLAADGQYQVSVVDRGFLHDDGSHYTLTIEPGPRLWTTRPTAVIAGKPHAVTLLGYDLPDGTARGTAGLVTLLLKPAKLTGQLPYPGSRWPDRRPVGVLGSGFPLKHPGIGGDSWISISTEPVLPEPTAPNETTAQAHSLQLPVRVCGTFEQSADIDWYSFKAAKGQPLEIVGWGERLGRSMQLEAIIHDAAGKPLVTLKPPVAPKSIGFDFPFTTSDPHANWTPPADGRYLIVVRDLLGGSLYGPERAYQLVIRSPRKRFTVFAAIGDGKTSAGLSIPAGGSAKLQVVVLRLGGWKGPVTITAGDLPAGVTAAPTTIAAGKPVAQLTLKAGPKTPPGLSLIRLSATGTIGKAKRERVVLPLARIPAPGPAVRVADGLLLAVTPVAPAKPKPKTTATKKTSSTKPQP